MKIIISRKGFDSSFGGCPSPIDRDTGQMMSFPIPGGVSPHRYTDIKTPWGELGPLAAQLSKRPAMANAFAHLDPDLNKDALPRQADWKPSLGQVDAAQSHLEKQKVNVGDVFLFFGWFRKCDMSGGSVFVREEKDMHAFFGYLQIGEILRLGKNPPTKDILGKMPWLHDHPHMLGERSENNTLYIASQNLLLNGRDTGLPGAGSFDYFKESLKLTAPLCSKSVWRVPDWMEPGQLSSLSYHGDKTRWFKNEESEQCLRSVAKGQEFVFDTKNDARALSWVEDLITTGLSANLIKKQTLKKSKKV